MSDRVSVVVPVYNVKNYLQDCLDSLTAQDYDNLQIILVDDGSTDGSGDMCDSYAAGRGNVEVIHQKNAGLSAARNAGTAAAAGAYIAFIDSDDWVSPDYISYQMKLMKKHNADIVATRQLQVWDGDKPPVVDASTEKISVYNREQALDAILYGYDMKVSACKLFRTALIEKHPFQVGALYEDLGIMYTIIADADVVVNSNLPKYFYRRRAGSIINGTFDRRRLILLEHANRQYDFIQKNYPQLIKGAGYRCAYCVTELAPMVLTAKDRETFKEIRAELVKHYDDLVHNPRALMKHRVRGFAIRHGEALARAEMGIENFLKKRLGKNLFGGE